MEHRASNKRIFLSLKVCSMSFAVAASLFLKQSKQAGLEEVRNTCCESIPCVGHSIVDGCFDGLLLSSSNHSQTNVKDFYVLQSIILHS
ncbi:hypothetical protein Tco_0879741 [Tanacetum coccineum]